MTWYKINPDNTLIRLYIQPGAKQNEIVGLIQDELKIKLASSAIDGRANKSLTKLLSELLKVPKSTIRIKSGEKSRHKCIEINSKNINPTDLLS